MRFVERSEAAPESLLEKGAAELDKARAYYAEVPAQKKSYKFKVYKLKAVKDALERLFQGKCAYCESPYAVTQPMDVEHFRPKGAVVEEKDHRGYWWLAMQWENLLPSCIDCNRKRNQVTPKGDTSQVRLLDDSLEFTSSVTMGSGKKDSFPLADTGIRAALTGDDQSLERPLLLDPCKDDPDRHLRYFFDRVNPVSFVLARALVGDPDYTGPDQLSLKGATSVHVYGLNRLRLVQARTEVLRRLEFLAELAIDLLLLAQEIDPTTDDLERLKRQVSGYGDRILAELARMADSDQPYCAMAKAWLAEFRARVEAQV